MIGPSRLSYEIAVRRHDERLAQAARIRDLRGERRHDARPTVNAGPRRAGARLASAITALRTALHP